jgi:bifunctional DNA-binding transcriptional regulator/antitoxin component of YhaV-PrlF toxin-antitoxin module
MGEKFLSKVKVDDDLEYYIKIPKEIVDKLNLKQGSFVDFTAQIPEEYVVEVEKPVLEELHIMKEKWPMYKNKDESEILKDIMIKFNKKDSEEPKIPNKPLRVVEKGLL